MRSFNRLFETNCPKEPIHRTVLTSLERVARARAVSRWQCNRRVPLALVFCYSSEETKANVDLQFKLHQQLNELL